MSLILNFRQPDPYVEEDGVRKPMSDYPDLKVIRTTTLLEEHLAGLREVNLHTGWLTLHAPAERSPWLVNPDCRPQYPGEWEETATNLRIVGIAKGTTDDWAGKPVALCITGIVRRARRSPVKQEAPPAVKPPPVLGTDVVRTKPMSSRPDPKPVKPVEPLEPPSVAQDPAPTDPDDWLDAIGKL